MASISINEFVKELKKWPEITTELRFLLDSKSETLYNNYRGGIRRNHRTSGKLLNSIKLNKFFDEWEVGSDSKVAGYIEFGTRAHTITPKFKKALRFFVESIGAFVFAKSVEHPGTKANPILTKEYIKEFGFREQKLEREIDEILTKVLK